MASGYERATKEIIPAVRYALIKTLNSKYSQKEEEIADSLGMTQAAISKYINGKFSDKIKSIGDGIDAGIVDAYAEKIAAGNKEMANVCICTICNKLNSFGCSFSKAESKTSV
jgi:predicted transcriptional regulator